jgi:hypothetical protein
MKLTPLLASVLWLAVCHAPHAGVEGFLPPLEKLSKLPPLEHLNKLPPLEKLVHFNKLPLEELSKLPPLEHLPKLTTLEKLSQLSPHLSKLSEMERLAKVKLEYLAKMTPLEQLAKLSRELRGGQERNAYNHQVCICNHMVFYCMYRSVLLCKLQFPVDF